MITSESIRNIKMAAFIVLGAVFCAMLYAAINAFCHTFSNYLASFKKHFSFSRKAKKLQSKISKIIANEKELDTTVRHCLDEKIPRDEQLDLYIAKSLKLDPKLDAQKIQQISQEIKKALCEKLKKDLLVLIENIQTKKFLVSHISKESWRPYHSIHPLTQLRFNFGNSSGSFATTDSIVARLKSNLLEIPDKYISNPEIFLQDALIFLIECNRDAESIYTKHIKKINHVLDSGLTSDKIEEIDFLDPVKNNAEFQKLINNIVKQHIPSAQEGALSYKDFISYGTSKIEISNLILHFENAISQLQSKKDKIFESLNTNFDVNLLKSHLELFIKNDCKSEVDDSKIEDTCNEIKKILTGSEGILKKIFIKQLQNLINSIDYHSPDTEKWFDDFFRQRFISETLKQEMTANPFMIFLTHLEHFVLHKFFTDMHRNDPDFKAQKDFSISQEEITLYIKIIQDRLTQNLPITAEDIEKDIKNLDNNDGKSNISPARQKEIAPHINKIESIIQKELRLDRPIKTENIKKDLESQTKVDKNTIFPICQEEMSPYIDQIKHVIQNKLINNLSTKTVSEEDVNSLCGHILYDSKCYLSKAIKLQLKQSIATSKNESNDINTDKQSQDLNNTKVTSVVVDAPLLDNQAAIRG